MLGRLDTTGIDVGEIRFKDKTKAGFLNDELIYYFKNKGKIRFEYKDFTNHGTNDYAYMWHNGDVFNYNILFVINDNDSKSIPLLERILRKNDKIILSTEMYNIDVNKFDIRVDIDSKVFFYNTFREYLDKQIKINLLVIFINSPLLTL